MKFRFVCAALIGLAATTTVTAVSAHNRDAIAPTAEAARAPAAAGEIKVGFSGVFGFMGCVRVMSEYNRSRGGKLAENADALAMYDCMGMF